MNNLGTIEHDFNAPYYDSNLTHSKDSFQKNKAMHEKWLKRSFGSFEPKTNWKRCFAGREEYA